jgi:mRNA-degrading endonuclease RelE of RelBE toxin-antitoxin system
MIVNRKGRIRPELCTIMKHPGYHSARRGAYRVIYRIDDAEQVVHVVRIDHRVDVYRTI